VKTKPATTRQTAHATFLKPCDNLILHLWWF